MIRTLLVCLTLSTPTLAQEIDLPDVNILRDSGRFDLTTPPPRTVALAIAAAEDPDFFTQDPGVSTVSRQLVKNMLLSGERTSARAAMEIKLAADLAAAFTRTEIMTLYAEHIYLGANCYGFDPALEHRLGITGGDVPLPHALTLAVLIAATASLEQDAALYQSRFAAAVTAGREAGFWDDATAQSLTEAGPIALIDGAKCPSEF